MTREEWEAFELKVTEDFARIMTDPETPVEWLRLLLVVHEDGIKNLRSIMDAYEAEKNKKPLIDDPLARAFSRIKLL